MSTLHRPIRIIIADDHELYRDGFRSMLTRLPELELLGEATDGEELLQLTAEVQPDVVVTDIKMPRMDGIEATRHIKKEFPSINVIALSMFDDESLIIDMLEAGAKGYLLKNAHKEEIVEAVKTVFKNDVYYCNQTTIKLAQLIASSKFNPYRKKARPVFSEREVQVIEQLIEGLSSKQIGEKLGLKQRTIESYREKIMEKMGVNNVAGVIVYAMKNGFAKKYQ